MRVIVFSFILVGTFFVIGLPRTSACLVCDVVKGEGFFCGEGQVGGKRCRTDADGRICGLVDPCGDPEVQSSKGERAIQLGSGLLKDVALVHPRFAVALAFAKKNDMLQAGGEVRVALMPDQADSEYANEYIEKGAASETRRFFRGLKRGAESVDNRKKITPVQYRIRVEESDKLVLRVINGHQGDPPFSLLEINLLEEVKPSGKTVLRGSVWTVR